MPEKYNINDIRREYRELIELRKKMMELNQEELTGFSRIFDLSKKIKQAEEEHNHFVQSKNDMMKTYEEFQKKAEERGLKIHRNTHKAFLNDIKQQNKIIKLSEKRVQILQREYKIIQGINKGFKTTIGLIGNMLQTDMMKAPFMSYLMEFDQSVRNAALYIGLSAENAEILRTNFEDAHKMAARLGATGKDLATIQTSFADETGRSRMLTSKMLEDVIKLSQGTGIGAEQAGNLAGKFELIGYNASTTMQYIENVVDMSERVGVNVNKIISKLNLNFKRLQTYNFKYGVDGMAKMAIYGEKYKMDITSVLDSMDKARNLEGVIDMAANLQVLGGQFAAMADPMAMLFESRNDPEAYAKRINKMTQGLVTLNKTAEGFSFELASPMARDMLDKAAKALGMSTEELTQQAFRQKELMEMRKQMLGMNLSQDQKQLIEKVAQFDNKTGKFTITIGQEVHTLTNMSRKQIDLLKTEQEGLEKRAKNAQTFENLYQNTINEFKTILLPLLRGVNVVMGWARKIIEPISDWMANQKDFTKGAMTFAGAIMAFTPIVPRFLHGLSKYVGFLGKNIGGGTKIGRTPKTRTPKTIGGGNIMGSIGAGLGVGLAGVGVGTGINIAASGISKIADSLEKLDIEKVKALQSITTTLSVITGIAAAAGAAIIIFGKAALVSTPGIWSLAGAIGVVGGAIGVATAGIGFMSLGLSQLIEKGVQSKDSLLQVAGGIAAIQGALAMGIFGSLGLLTFAGTLNKIAKHSDKINSLGNSFKSISTVLKGSSEEYERLNNLIKTISNFDGTNMNNFSKLSKILDKPLKVEFEDKEINLVSNITLEIDGEKFIEKTNLVKRLNIRGKKIYEGKSSR